MSKRFNKKMLRIRISDRILWHPKPPPNSIHFLNANGALCFNIQKCVDGLSILRQSLLAAPHIATAAIKSWHFNAGVAGDKDPACAINSLREMKRWQHWLKQINNPRSDPHNSALSVRNTDVRRAITTVPATNRCARVAAGRKIESTRHRGLVGVVSSPAHAASHGSSSVGNLSCLDARSPLAEPTRSDVVSAHVRPAHVGCVVSGDDKPKIRPADTVETGVRADSGNGPAESISPSTGISEGRQPHLVPGTNTGADFV